MGYAKTGQDAAGIHIRLFARAFIFADEAGTRLCIVNADIGVLSQAVKLEVRTDNNTRHFDHDVPSFQSFNFFCCTFGKTFVNNFKLCNHCRFSHSNNSLSLSSHICSQAVLIPTKTPQSVWESKVWSECTECMNYFIAPNNHFGMKSLSKVLCAFIRYDSKRSLFILRNKPLQY